MKHVIIRPVYPPPKLDNYCHLSTEAQVTLLALEAKYDNLLKSVQKKEASDHTDYYYKSIYNASFKKENSTQLLSEYNGYDKSSESKCLDNKTYHSGKRKSSTFKQRKEEDFCSEIFMTEKPPDDEIAQSILSLTQKTSAPESPLIDFENDNSDDHDCNEKISFKRVKLGQHFSQLASHDGTKALHKNWKAPSNSHTCNTNIVNEDKDMENFMNVNKEMSYVSSKNVKEITTSNMLPSENPLHEVPKGKENSTSNIWNVFQAESNLKENPCPSPVTRNEKALISPGDTTFDLNVSDCEIEKLDSPLNKANETKEKSSSSKPLTRETEGAEDEESPLFIKSEIISQSPQKLNSLKRKPTYMKLMHIHSNKHAVTPLIQVPSASSSSKKLVKLSKSQNKPKGKQAGFKPPLKNTDSACTNNDQLTPNVVNFESLTTTERMETFKIFKSSSTIVMTLLFDNGSALCTTYPPAMDIQEVVKRLAVLVNQTCYLISSAFMKKELGMKILELLSAEKATKIISNCKDFLIGLWHLLDQDNEHDWHLPYLNVQDPCIAIWLLDPEQSPSSFKQMCGIGGLQLENDDDSWLNCLKATPLLMKALETKLSSFNQWTLYTEIEMRLVPILACMERRPIKVHAATFLDFSSILKSKLAKLEEKIYKEVGHEFSINSHMQLRQVLYEELKIDQKLPVKAKIGKTNVAHLKSTSEATLSQFIDIHPLPSLVLEYRQLQKLKSTYVDGMMSAVHNGSLSTHWDQTAAATGRLTSSRPNIQAVPKMAITITDYQTSYVIGTNTSSEAKINVREPFISREGFLLLSADFQQIELRILAHLSEDSSLLSTFWQPNSNDVFIALTAKWQGKDVASVTFTDREQTKRVVYSVMYGVGKDKLAQYLKVKPDAAKSLMTSFLEQFPAIDNFTKKCYEFAKEFGYTETICARRRYFPRINSPSPVLRAQAQRQAVNFCVQGSAADICKLAMLSVEEALKKQNEIECRLLFQIHDELIWEVKEDQLQQVKALVQGVMENMKSLCGKFCNLQVPLAVSLSSGSSWAHLSPMNNSSQPECEKITKNSMDCQSNPGVKT